VRANPRLAELGLMLHATGPVVDGVPVVWVATPQLDAPSETFVQAHIARLPAAVKLLSDSYLQLPSATIARALRASRAEVLLAEHGQTGVAVMAAAQEAGVRLVVHFHGCDAYQRVILERYARSYRELFEQAAAIIAVSHDMERQLLSLGAPAERLFYNPCGVDSTAFAGGDPAPRRRCCSQLDALCRRRACFRRCGPLLSPQRAARRLV